MKKISLLIASVVFCFAANAKIWRVNNTGLPSDFKTLQAANDSASVSAGDTVHLESSQNSYGNLTATKRLIILGTGYFLNQNLNNQQDQRGATVGTLTFNVGSEGTVVSGLNITTFNFQTSNISAVRNYIGNVYIYTTAGGYSNVSIIQNYVAGTITYGGYVQGSYSNVVISNNYVGSGISYPAIFSTVIVNNVIGGNNAGISVYNSNLQNNIVNATITINSGNNISYNICGSAAALPATNLTSVNIANLFVTSGTTDGIWQLASASLAKGAGAAGADCGMYGGPNPYKISGMPAIPSIYYLSAPVSTNSNTLPVVISVKSNN